MIFLFKLHNAKIFVLFIHDVNTRPLFCQSINGSEILPSMADAGFLSLVIVTIRMAQISIGKSFTVFYADIEILKWQTEKHNVLCESSSM